MNKKIGAIALIAGTAIGSGMIALPMTLGKLGIIPSVILMLSIWILVYYTSLASVELNLQAGKGLTLGALGRKYSGPYAEWIGFISIKLLSYSLLSAYVYGGTSIIHKTLIGARINFNFYQVAAAYTALSILVLSFPIKSVDYVNRLLFSLLLAVVTSLILGLLLSLQWNDLPLWNTSHLNIVSLAIVTPIVFTSFGFQVIFHTLTNYCNKDPKLLKTAFFWGSLIPTLTYILWTFSILGVLYHHNKTFFFEVVLGKVDVGDMIKELSMISQSKYIQILSWWVSVLAIFTSVIGVGLGLTDSWKHSIEDKFNSIGSHIVSVVLSIVPAFIIAILVPNAFLRVLAFAGMVLVIIAILLPLYLLYQGNFKKLHYPVLNNKIFRALAAVSGSVIILFELFNIFG